MMKISIITVVYNNECIATAIESVLRQDYPFIEYIVVDGGSTDHTLDIIAAYRNRIQRVVSEPDLGIYDAINKGIRMASGDVVGLLHSDDFLADDQVISRIAAVFAKQPAHPTFYAERSLFEQFVLYSTKYKIAGDFELLMRFLYIHKVKALYVRDVWVKMRMGGVSTSGLKSLMKLNGEIVRACKTNEVYTNTLMVYSKYMVKWWGFCFRKT